MKVQITLIDDDGRVYRGEALLHEGALARQTRARGAKKDIRSGRSNDTNSGTSPTPEDFQLPARAFVKRFATKMGGPKKFVLLLAFMTKGELETLVKGTDLAQAWDRMSGPLGGPYQTMYATRASENGWVNSEKRQYRLLRDWKAIFS
jgi:hypothetical protein